MPDVAPVTTATRPVAGGRKPSLNSGSSRERTEMPIREKLPMTLASSSASAARASGLIRLPRTRSRHSRAQHRPRAPGPARPAPSGQSGQSRRQPGSGAVTDRAESALEHRVEQPQWPA